MKRHAWVGNLAALALALACRQEQEPVAEPLPIEAPLETAKSAALGEVGRLLAHAVGEPTLRSLLHEELRRSPLKEGKLHLQTFLQGPGAPLREAMARTTSSGPEKLSQLLNQIGSVELYLPVAEHRQRWRGGGELIIATQWDERETPTGVDLRGKPVSLSLDAPPDTPTLVLVPAEAFNERGKPYEKPGQGLATGSSTSHLGLWINAVHTKVRQYEPWTRGDPEFEFHLQNTAEPDRPTIICVDADHAIEPYMWDMNSDYYFAPFLVAGHDIFPEGTPHLIIMWEDDDEPCRVKASMDFERETLKLFLSAAEVYKLIKSKDFMNERIVVNVYNAAIAMRSIIQGNDDYVGTSAGRTSISSTPVQFLLMNELKTPTGWIHLQWKEDVAY